MSTVTAVPWKSLLVRAQQKEQHIVDRDRQHRLLVEPRVRVDER